MTSIAGRPPAPLPPLLQQDCVTVKNEIAAVVQTLRTGTAPTGASLVAVQDTASRVRRLVGQPGVAPYLYGCIEDIVMDDIRNNFSEIIKSRMSARARLLFIARFHQASMTITKVVQFCAQSLESTYGTRCRLIPLHKLQFVAMHDIFSEHKTRIVQLVIGALNDLRSGEDELEGPVTLASEFVRDVLKERDSLVLLNATNTKAMSHRGGIGDEESWYIKSVAATAAPFYQHAAPQQLRSLGNVLAYGRWVSAQLKREKELLRVLGMQDDFPVIARALQKVMIGFSGLTSALEHGLAIEIEAGNDVSELFLVLGSLSVGEQGGIDMASTAYRKLLRKELGSRMKVVAAAAAVLPRDKVADDDLKAAVTEALRFMRMHHNEVIPKCFLNHHRFYSIWTEVVTLALRAYHDTPRLVSDSIDVYLSNSKAVEDEAAEVLMLDFYKNIFMCIVQKDEFFANYKAALARRLLRSQFRRTLEAQFLARLKVVSGNAEVYPLNAMIADIDNSDKLTADMLDRASMDAFLTREKIRPKVTLATAQYWPTFELIDMAPHPLIAEFATLFESFYQSRFPNRRVRWMYMASSAVVTTRFTQGPKELSGSLIQATVLLMADGTNGRKLPEIAAATTLRKETVADAIASMYMNKKVNVLECVDPATGLAMETKKITDNHCFRINASFKSPSRKIDLPKSRAAKAVDMTQIENLRKELAKIAIVRFMKSRGTATYAEMVDSALADLRRKFDAQPPLVKSQLEELIDREIVRRDDNDAKRLHYVA